MQITDDQLRNAVRTFITNDLGITRNYLDQNIDDLIQERVNVALKKYLHKSEFNIIVRKQLESILSDGRFTRSDRLADELAKQIGKQVAESIEVNVKE